MTSYLVVLRSISFWLCRLLLKRCEIFVLKFDCEIPRGFGEIKVYTFGIGYSMGEVENFEMEPEVPVGYNFVALVALIILFKNPK